MKILTIAATPFFADRGSHVRMYNEYKYLKKYGADIKICTYHNGRDLEGVDISRIGDVFWYTKLSPGFHWGKLWLDLKLFFLCLKEIKTYQPDVIHAHLFEGLAVAYFSRMFLSKKIPIVSDIQGNLNLEFKSYNRNQELARNFFVFFSGRVIKWADWVIVSNENAVESIKEIFGQPQKVTVIGDGIDFDHYQNPKEASEKLKNQLHLIRTWQAEKKILIYTGGFSDNKGVFNLLKAFVTDRNLHKDWKLLLAGSGDEKKKYQKYLKENNAQNAVLITDLDYFSLPHYLALADIAIDPKEQSSEGSGKIAGYIASGVPVICFENKLVQTNFKSSDVYLIDDFSQLSVALKKALLIEKNKIEYLDQAKEVAKLYQIIDNLYNKK